MLTLCGANKGKIMNTELDNHFVQIAAGANHSIALRNDGRVICWGGGRYGQVPPDLKDVIQIVAGYGFSLALTNQGRVVGWPESHVGPLAYRQGLIIKSYFCNLQELKDVIQIAAGRWHFLVLLSNGTVIAWGDNQYGQCNVPSTLRDVVYISAGMQISVAVTRDSQVVEWGKYGSFTYDIPDIVQVIPNQDDGRGILALTKEGKVFVLYDGITKLFIDTILMSKEYKSQKTQIDILRHKLCEVTSIVRGKAYILFLTKNGEVLKLGAYEKGGRYGKDEIEFTGSTDHLLEGLHLHNVTQIAAGLYHSLALTKEGRILAWGRNDEAQCNVPPVYIDGVQHLPDFLQFGVLQEVYRGGAATVPSHVSEPFSYHKRPKNPNYLLVRVDGQCFSWDVWNTHGELYEIQGLRDIVKLSGGGFRHTLALTKEGKILAWGPNNSGQCNIPHDLHDVVDISAGADYSLALTKSGQVIAWGANDLGQCNVPRNLHDVVQVVSGGNHSLALTKSGQVVAWGNNRNKQCDVPKGLFSVTTISAEYGYSLALLSNGQLLGWGGFYPREFILGYKSKFYKVPHDLREVVAVVSNDSFRLVFTKNGRIYKWTEGGFYTVAINLHLQEILALGLQRFSDDEILVLTRDGRVLNLTSNVDEWVHSTTSKWFRVKDN